MLDDGLAGGVAPLAVLGVGDVTSVITHFG